MNKRKAIRNINELIAKELKEKKVTAKLLEEHAKDVCKYGNLSKENREFYRGFLRAIELLRKHDLLKGETS